MRWLLFVFMLMLFGCDMLLPTKSASTTSMDEEVMAPLGRLSWQKPDIVLNTLGDISGKKIADIGAGAGYFTFRMVKREANVIAIDVDPRMIQLVELFRENMDSTEQQRVETRLVPDDDPQLTDNEVDIAIIINTAAYIEDRVAYFEKIKKGVRDDGILMIVDFKTNVDISSDVLPENSPKIAYSVLTDELEKAGYDLIRVNESHLPYQYIVYALL